MDTFNCPIQTDVNRAIDDNFHRPTLTPNLTVLQIGVQILSPPSNRFKQKSGFQSKTSRFFKIRLILKSLIHF